MNRILKTSVSLALFLPAIAGAQVVNGDFETGALAPWFTDRTAFCFGVCTTWGITTADAHTGTYSATVQGNVEIRQNFAPVLADNITSFSFWLKQPEACCSYVSFFYTDATESNTLVFPSGGWQHWDVTSTLVSGKTLSGFSIFGFSGGNEQRTYLDDVTMVTHDPGVVPEPATTALLATGLVGIFGAARMRRRR